MESLFAAEGNPRDVRGPPFCFIIIYQYFKHWLVQSSLILQCLLKDRNKGNLQCDKIIRQQP